MEKQLLKYAVADGFAAITMPDPPANTHTQEIMRHSCSMVQNSRGGPLWPLFSAARVVDL